MLIGDGRECVSCACAQSTGALTFFGKTAAMLQGSDEKSNLQKLLERIMVILSVLCFACSIAVFVVLLMEGARGRTGPAMFMCRRCVS